MKKKYIKIYTLNKIQIIHTCYDYHQPDIIQHVSTVQVDKMFPHGWTSTTLCQHLHGKAVNGTLGKDKDLLRAMLLNEV